MSQSWGCLWACAEGRKEMVSELQVYKRKTVASRGAGDRSAFAGLRLLLMRGGGEAQK